MREFSLPALYEVPADGNLTDLIRRNAAQHPEVAVLARKQDGEWVDVTAADFLTEVQTAAKGLIAAGVAAVYPNLWLNDGLVMSESVSCLLVSLVLWAGFLSNYPLTRDIYFTVAMLHVLAEAPFLLRLL